ncbi:dihydropteroate synthase [Spirosoma montaniterrae]|uniref:dihydropteroate synthase n=1 Tax=Spirosoma montaniterrae TaxID=1178516 RepID=A0A1P9WVF0_9BACT|nr:dihydropteroate synthase [Spirosoma montaniterrae]AQG79341.1 dihydropteroate synthase [Spirosoma montaniterrae]
MPKGTKKTLNCRGRLIDLTTPVVMGILNVTPDSFYTGSRVSANADLVERAGQMLADGATFIDIGGYSTRPGANDISPAEEADRVLPAIEAVLRQYPNALISVDTFRAEVARQAVDAGASMVNDVAGGTLDPLMFETVAGLGVPYVLMHLRGNPKTMQSLSVYENLVVDVVDEIGVQLAKLRALGAKDVLLDPGFGFAKTPAQNFELLSQLNAFQQFDEPLLIGLSRKSTIWKTLNISADAALNGTTVLNTAALLKGASVLRVHDVREAVEAIKLSQRLNFF